MQVGHARQDQPVSEIMQRKLRKTRRKRIEHARAPAVQTDQVRVLAGFDTVHIRAVAQVAL